MPEAVAYDILSCEIGRPIAKGITHKVLEQTLDSLTRADAKKSTKLAQLSKTKSLIKKNGEIAVVSSSSVKEKPRYKQHSAAIFLNEKAVILGPSARVDFFPIPAGIVLDQKVHVSNPGLFVKKFNGI